MANNNTIIQRKHNPQFNRSMKFKILLFTLTAFSLNAFSQTKNDLSVVYGFANTHVDIHGAIGDFGYNTKTGNSIGILYIKKITRSLSLQTGFFYADDNVEEDSILPGRAGINLEGDAKIISIPVIARFTFLKYLFADAGFSIDRQTNYRDNTILNDQSGIGYEMGIGAQFTFKRVTLFVNPYFKSYSFIHFNSQEDFNLFENGFKFGLGYNFN